MVLRGLCKADFLHFKYLSVVASAVSQGLSLSLILSL